jgi:SAM-dependent methyltransferase
MVLDERPEGSGKPSALDVGCGPGLVMEILSSLLDVQGVDADPAAVRASGERGQRAMVAAAEDLPFEDGSFDIVYCSFLLLWVPDPVRVLREMARVSREWVICLAEPDHLGRISYPPGVALLDHLFVDALREQGADPGMGRKLQGTFAACGLRPVTGVHANMWSFERMRDGSEAEWLSLTSSIDRSPLADVRKAWDDALANGSLVQYNPVFYALARKCPSPQERSWQE